MDVYQPIEKEGRGTSWVNPWPFDGFLYVGEGVLTGPEREMLSALWQLRCQGRWDAANEIRDELNTLGIGVEFLPSGQQRVKLYRSLT